MNKLLVAIFDTEKAANSGLNALRNLHAAGDITLFSNAVLAKDANGSVSVKGIGSGYWRVVGEVDELIGKAKEMAQRTLLGTGFARILRKI